MELSFPVSSAARWIQGGWVFITLLAVILTFFLVHFYFQREELQALKNHEVKTLQEIEGLKKKIAYYQLALESLEDPAWIEKQMIEKLGVVPKGYKAIYFKGESD